MQAANIEDIYRVSPTQHGILFEELSAPAESRYTVQLLVTLRGRVNKGALARAINLVSERYAVPAHLLSLAADSRTAPGRASQLRSCAAYVSRLAEACQTRPA
jgi:hypothetical protein